jgi:putative spermidine/putrescine transport system permease protein
VAVVERFDLRLEGAALSLGASPWRSFRRVTLPVILPGIYSGAIYGFMASFTDVPVTVFLTGPHLVTYPVEVFDTMRSDFDGTLLASCTLVIGISVAIMLIGQRAARLGTLIRAGPAAR